MLQLFKKYEPHLRLRRQTGFVSSAEFIGELVELLGEGRGKQFVDLGSGGGIVVACAAAQGYNATGIEINPELVSVSKKYLKELELSQQFSGQATIQEGSYYPVDYVPSEPVVKQREYELIRMRKNGTMVNCLHRAPGTFDFATADVIYSYPWGPQTPEMLEIFSKYSKDARLISWRPVAELEELLEYLKLTAKTKGNLCEIHKV